MHLFGIDFSSFFQPLLALCGALALVLNARNQDLARLIRSGTEQVTKRENGQETIDADRKSALRRQAILFRERILIVQQALLLTYTAGIMLTLMACFPRLPVPNSALIAGAFGAIGILCLLIAIASAVRDVSKSLETIELELISAYGEDILPHRSRLLEQLFATNRRSLWVRLSEGVNAFGKAFQATDKDYLTATRSAGTRPSPEKRGEKEQ